MRLTPRQWSTGGKPRLGKISKMGQRDLRRLLIIGASAVVHWARKRGAPEGYWLERMLLRKPHAIRFRVAAWQSGGAVREFEVSHD
jgi:transposase